MTRYEKIRYILTPAIGFGIGGALWGWRSFRFMETAGGVEISTPFFIMLGAVFLGIFGSISLVLFLQNVKVNKKALFVLGGLFAWVAGFYVGAIGVYLFLFGGVPLWYFLLLVIKSISKIGVLSIDKVGVVYETVASTAGGLKPGLGIGFEWLAFLVIGVIIAIFYALTLKTKMWPLVWRGGVGFASASIIGSIFGNSLGNNSVFASYIITFSVIGVILGVFLGWGVWSGRRDDLRVG